MTDWKVVTCAPEGPGFIVAQTLDWPLPLTGEVGMMLELAHGEPAEFVEFELQTDFSGRFSAFSSNGLFELHFVSNEDLFSSPETGGLHVLTGAVIRHRADSEESESFTALARIPRD